MANAHRESDAFILFGVQEVDGDVAKVIGISGHIDDAHLQQFVNEKTNRPIQLVTLNFRSMGRGSRRFGFRFNSARFI